MKSIGSYLLMIFSFAFWIFRIGVVLVAQVGGEFVVQPLNLEVEIIMLFITLPILLWLIKRKMIPAILYLGMYTIYFGVDLYQKVVLYMEEGLELAQMGMTAFISSVAMILAICQFISIIILAGKGGNDNDKKTDWFYKDKKYDRELDERADKNNYRTL
ncbi:MAG: hypothetical protein Q4G05_02800 [Clostridia bacterium]|nr:hypothetical protein [Clostridia bacterium]